MGFKKDFQLQIVPYGTIYSRDNEEVGMACNKISLKKSASIFPHNDMTTLVG